MPAYWLMKSEPDVFSIDDLARDGVTGWTGVRNYQARNFMRDTMQVGDTVLFYHSNARPPGVAGLARVRATGLPDPTAFDRKSEYYDPKSDPAAPTWIMVEVAYVATFPRFVPLDTLRAESRLAGLLVLQRGMRLSIQPVEPAHARLVQKMGGL
jgi:predicted RNA-binding protein with PUA-like domain